MKKILNFLHTEDRGLVEASGGDIAGLSRFHWKALGVFLLGLASFPLAVVWKWLGIAALALTFILLFTMLARDPIYLRLIEQKRRKRNPDSTES